MGWAWAGPGVALGWRRLAAEERELRRRRLVASAAGVRQNRDSRAASEDPPIGHESEATDGFSAGADFKELRRLAQDSGVRHISEREVSGGGSGEEECQAGGHNQATAGLQRAVASLLEKTA